MVTGEERFKHMSDELMADAYRSCRDQAMMCFDELIRRGCKITHKGSTVNNNVSTEELKITKTTVKEI